MFYLTEITTTDKISKAVYQYETLDEAKANYHSKMGAQMKAAACKDELCIIFDGNGAVHVSDHYIKPVTAPEE